MADDDEDEWEARERLEEKTVASALDVATLRSFQCSPQVVELLAWRLERTQCHFLGVELELQGTTNGPRCRRSELGYGELELFYGRLNFRLGSWAAVAGHSRLCGTWAEKCSAR